MKAFFDHSDDETEHIKTFWFRPERHLDYIAGQYIELTILHANADNRGQKRWFTLSSSPGHALVSITTRSGDSTFKRALFALKPGAEIQLAEAMGDFVLPRDETIPLVFIAGGIGITPFHSIVEWLVEHDERRSITFIYGVRSEDDIMFTSTFKQATIDPHIIISEPSDSWRGGKGNLNTKRILGIAKPRNDTLIYMSGPEPMVEQLKKDMLLAGVTPRQLVTDLFVGYSTQ